jgi:putative membrane protein insertion efficiency factor
MIPVSGSATEIRPPGAMHGRPASAGGTCRGHAPAGDAGRSIALGAIRVYQVVLRPILPAACRFLPSCSDYGREAIARHGLARGGWLLLRRLIRCQPFAAGGFDPVR